MAPLETTTIKSEEVGVLKKSSSLEHEAGYFLILFHNAESMLSHSAKVTFNIRYINLAGYRLGYHNFKHLTTLCDVCK